MKQKIGNLQALCAGVLPTVGATIECTMAFQQVFYLSTSGHRTSCYTATSYSSLNTPIVNITNQQSIVCIVIRHQLEASLASSRQAL
jgi:hypothetical protein